ncbi:ABC transporter substrate-binding protein [Methanomassiliicoccus luminyensis]|uniref:ABC transporter substrate-binding protein n=1 Tax=Methanomassiliicoccus luminyensis TaxID=1080712 RepID=UPI000361E95E|nr:ABC transporter substrate-binding protein [Methanomassiliicoccus luminyensis]
MKRKLAVAALAVVVIVASLFAAAFVLAPSEDDGMDIRITYSNKVDYEPFIIASALGCFEDEGLNVTPLIVSGGVQSAEAIATGSADLAAMGDAPAVTMMSTLPGARLVASYGGGEGMHRLVGNATIPDVASLAGKKVGVQAGSSSEGALIRLLETNGFDQSQIENMIVPLAPADMPAAVKTDQVDAVMGSEPWPLNVENYCGSEVHEIATSAGLGSTYPLSIMASQKAVAEKPEAITAVLKAIDRAIEYMEANPSQAVEMCAEIIGISAANEEKCLSSLDYHLGLNATDLESLNITAEFLLGAGKINVLPDVVASTDMTFLRAAKGDR